MNKLFSLLKVVLKDDFSLFKINNQKGSKLSKILFPILLTLLIFYSVGYYSFIMADKLAPVNLTYVVLTIWIVLVSVMTIVECIYKSQGILFDSKDNDMLMSLPINKQMILTVRIIKLILFQIMYDALFMLPAFAVYAFYVHPGVSYYLLSLLMLILMPIIPTVIASLVGAIVKNLSSIFKNKKAMQTIFSLLFTFLILYGSISLQSMGESFVNNAEAINNIITGIYYPIKLYLNLINNFNILDLLKLVGINLIFLIVFIYILSITYFKVIQLNHENIRHSTKKFKLTTNSAFVALVKKELKKYFSSPTYVLNTIFGLAMLLIAAIALAVKPDIILNIINKMGDESTTINMADVNITLYYLAFILFIFAMTSITSSSVSLEGKSFNLIKTLPVSTKSILLAKLVCSLVIIYPIAFISDIIVAVIFKIGFVNFILVLLTTIILPILIEIIGLLINIKYPKFEFKNDTEVIKQSMATMLSVYTGMGIAILIMVGYFYFIETFDFTILISLMLGCLAIITFILYKVLMIFGVKSFNKLNV